MSETWLVRYGVIPEVARFRADGGLAVERDTRVVVQSPRGLEIGTVLQQVPTPVSGGTAADADSSPLQIVRVATSDDETLDRELREDCQVKFAEWWSRIRDWQLELELVDLEWMLDREKLILYVLTGRGPDTTKLALFAATAGYSTVEVQPVTKDGLVPLKSEGGGCGCSSGGCSTH